MFQDDPPTDPHNSSATVDSALSADVGGVEANAGPVNPHNSGAARLQEPQADKAGE